MREDIISLKMGNFSFSAKRMLKASSSWDITCSVYHIYACCISCSYLSYCPCNFLLILVFIVRVDSSNLYPTNVIFLSFTNAADENEVGNRLGNYHYMYST